MKKKVFCFMTLFFNLLLLQNADAQSRGFQGGFSVGYNTIIHQENNGMTLGAIENYFFSPSVAIGLAPRININNLHHADMKEEVSSADIPLLLNWQPHISPTLFPEICLGSGYTIPIKNSPPHFFAEAGIGIEKKVGHYFLEPKLEYLYAGNQSQIYISLFFLGSRSSHLYAKD